MGQQLICFCLPCFFLENVVEIALIQSFVFEKFTSRKGLGDCLSLRFGSGHIGRSILTCSCGNFSDVGNKISETQIHFFKRKSFVKAG